LPLGKASGPLPARDGQAPDRGGSGELHDDRGDRRRRDGLAAKEMPDVVSSLASRNLYKSMTSHAHHKVWHDVYHVDTDRGVVYLKLTIVEDLLIISFKEKDE
jgi:hypothetical protein